MRDRLVPAILGAALALCLAPMLLPSLASAHIPSDFNAVQWASSPSNIEWYYDDSVPGPFGSNYKDRLFDGAQKWNDLCCAGGFDYVREGEVSGDYGTCYTNVDLVTFHGSVSGSAVAETGACPSSGDFSYVAIRFDSNAPDPWYKGADPSGQGGDELDLQSFATHEFGHATGTWNENQHFGSGECPGTASGDETMCPGLDSGHHYWRTLEWHDEHTFQSNY
jgi:hypothetical protein